MKVDGTTQGQQRVLRRLLTNPAAFDKNGNVTDAHVTTKAGLSSGASLLTNACVAAAKQWRFAPASVNKQFVNSTYSIVFVFKPRSDLPR